MNFLHWARVHWDRVVAVFCAGAGAAALLIGWNGASRTAYPAEQFPYLLSGGLVGLFLFGAGATLWLSADLRDEWGELRGIREELRVANQSRAAAGSDETGAVDALDGDNGAPNGDTVDIDGLDHDSGVSGGDTAAGAGLGDGAAAPVTPLVAGPARRA
jgi:hypothetical protein